MNLKATTWFLFLLIAFHAGASYAARVAHECDAERYIPCPTFRTSRTIGEHAPVTVRPVEGYVRSKGNWTITVGYGPAEKCAKVSLYVDMGPLDFDRKYERVFIDGGGAISDSGSFLHKIDDLESALNVHTTSCRVPAPERDPESRPDPKKTDDDSKERQALEAERERQELEAERERFALEEERERLALEEERERLAEEQRLAEERERRRLAQERRERERQRELARQRLARQRALARQQELARQRALARQRREQAESDAAAEVLLNLGVGILSGVIQHKSGRRGIGMGLGGTPSFRGGSCEQAKIRGAQVIQSQGMTSGGMCATYRSALRMYQTARQYLANGGCPAHEVRQYDNAIAQARRGVRAACR